MPSARHDLSFWTIRAALWVVSAPFAALAEADWDLAQSALPCLKSVLERSHHGTSELEAAAWLVETSTAGGELGCLAWPPTDETGLVRWSGPLPRRLVAQVHSHPTRATSGRKWTPRPSWNDCQTARQLGVPVLTVSLSGVYECRPADGRIVLRLEAGWERKRDAKIVESAQLELSAADEVPMCRSALIGLGLMAMGGQQALPETVPPAAAEKLGVCYDESATLIAKGEM